MGAAANWREDGTVAGFETKLVCLEQLDQCVMQAAYFFGFILCCAGRQVITQFDHVLVQGFQSFGRRVGDESLCFEQVFIPSHVDGVAHKTQY